MYNICLVNKMFHRLATPLLYECIESTKNDGIRVIQLVRQLIRKPELALHIRELRLSRLSAQLDELHEGNDCVAFDSEIKIALEGTPMSTGLVMRLKTALSGKRAMGDLHTAILMSLCSNLEAWKFQADDTFDLTEQVFVEAGAAQRANPPIHRHFPLQSLRSITAMFIGPERFDRRALPSVSRLYPHLQLPSIKSLRAVGFCIEDGWRGHESSVQRMQLQDIHARHHTPMLDEIFRFFPELTDLSLGWGKRELGSGGIHPGMMGNHLRNSGSRLRRLHLYLEEPFRGDMATRAFFDMLPISSLRELDRLAELSLPIVLLTDGSSRGRAEENGWVALPLTKVIPVSLQLLDIHDFRKWNERSLSRGKDMLRFSNECEKNFDGQLVKLLSDASYANLHTVRLSKRRTPAAALVANVREFGLQVVTDDYMNDLHFVELRK